MITPNKDAEGQKNAKEFQGNYSYRRKTPQKKPICDFDAHPATSCIVGPDGSFWCLLGFLLVVFVVCRYSCVQPWQAS